VVEPSATKNMTDEEAAAWLEDELQKPLGGCYWKRWSLVPVGNPFAAFQSRKLQ